MKELCNLDAEQQVLGSLLNFNQLYSKLADILRPEHFADTRHAQIYTTLGQLILEGFKADCITLKNKFDTDEQLNSIGGAQYLTLLQASLATPAAAKDYARHIIDLAQRRTLADLAKAMQAEVMEADYDNPANSIASNYSAKINDCIAGKSTQNSAGNIIANSIENGPPKITSTGYKRIDMGLEGGFYAGKFYCIAARMKAGKTALMASMAYNIAKQGYRVLYLALEMGGAEIQQRITARHIGCNAIHLARREIETERLLKAKADFDLMKLVYDDCPICTIEDITAKILGAEGKFDGVIIDYIQLVTGMNKGENEASFHARIAQHVAATVKRCPSLWVLSAAQLNREGEVRGSDGLRMAVDCLLKLETQDGVEGREAWLTMEATRYTPSTDIGDTSFPALLLNQKIGPYYQEI